MRAFSKILIANRGEIACRIIRTARAMGYQTVAVYSDVDRDALHARLADEAVCIGPAPVGESYLNSAALLKAVQLSGADAVHPGYGFLSENDAFASACEQAGIIFIGPSADAIRAMGNKAAAKRLMIAAGVPCVPGYQGADQSDEALVREAQTIGFPIMVKAAAGGGGRGMRLVSDSAAIGAAIIAARSEAIHAFGSGELILERAVLDARHVEIQVFGDSQGAVIHLGERDCSVQRRHQKVIEEAPSPAVNPALREKMGAAAVAAAKAIAYRGAGTVEFMLDSSGAFYFLEMNTRLQVEHPVTEEITGLDLVEWQLRIAAGEPLPLTQGEARLGGHAMEVRLYAEDPAQNFLPQSGDILEWRPSAGVGVRVDHGIVSGQAVSPFYDPMIAKVIGYGRTREEARRRLARALRETILFGLADNREFLIALLNHPDFIAGNATTSFIAKYFPEKSPEIARKKPDARWFALAGALLHERSADRAPALTSTWSSAGAVAQPLRLSLGEETQAASLLATGDGLFDVRVGDDRVALEILDRAYSGQLGCVRFIANGLQASAHFRFDRDALYLDAFGVSASVQEISLTAKSVKDSGGDSFALAPMNGRIVSVLAKVGETVKKGQTLVVLEAMKMQHEIVAGRDGIVESVAVAEGDQVATRKMLVALVNNKA